MTVHVELSLKPKNHSSPNSGANHPPEESDFSKAGMGPGCRQQWDEQTLEAAQRFAFRVPPAFAARINWQDPTDPLLLQVAPSAKELHTPAGFSTDPLDEAKFLQAPGLVAKYPGRVLLRLTGACPIHCRYCFRRHDLFEDVPQTPDEWQPAMEWIRRHETVQEVVFSGGDPLMVSNDQLSALSAQIKALGHVRRLRLHTRMPVCSPGRINDGLTDWLTGVGMMALIVIHVNHPLELGREACAALARLLDAGIPVLNQSVLLKGVNDRVETLTELSEKLIQNRVIPYYLHLLDPVMGAAHFHVGEIEARKLVNELRNHLPGYATPRLAQEIPGQLAKRVIDGAGVVDSRNL